MPKIDKRKVLESIDEYNRYRAPESIAELMKVKDNIIVVSLKALSYIAHALYLTG